MCSTDSSAVRRGSGKIQEEDRGYGMASQAHDEVTLSSANIALADELQKTLHADDINDAVTRALEYAKYFTDVAKDPELKLLIKKGTSYKELKLTGT